MIVRRKSKVIFGRFKVELSIAICALILVACNPLPPIPALPVPTAVNRSAKPSLGKRGKGSGHDCIACSHSKSNGDERQAEMLENEVLSKFPGA